jgi:DivIVA domain-containing protein
MSLNPMDVQQRTFGVALRGYRLEEVDDFLDQVVAALRERDTELADARSRIAALESEVAALQAVTRSRGSSASDQRRMTSD